MKRTARSFLLALPVIAILLVLVVNHQIEKRQAATARFLSLWHAGYDESRLLRVTQVQPLLDQGADINVHGLHGNTALMAMSDAHNLLVVCLLVSSGADVNARCILSPAPRQFHFSDLLHPLVWLRAKPKSLEVGDGSNALDSAAMAGDTDIALFLLKHGADPNVTDSRGSIPLIEVTSNGTQELVRQLVAAGADVNAQDRNGETPLNNSTLRCIEPIYETLLDHGADANCADFGGGTPLMSAAGNGCILMVQRLLAKGARVNAENSAKETALNFSAQSGDLAMVSMLLKHGANVHQVTSDSKTTLMAAALGGNAAIADLFLKLGVPVNVQDKDARP